LRHSHPPLPIFFYSFYFTLPPPQSSTLFPYTTLFRSDADQAAAALIADLKARGMLDDTLVIWSGEFGRTPYAENREKEKVGRDQDRKSTRLNSSHGSISYAVFCLKKKKKQKRESQSTD